MPVCLCLWSKRGGRTCYNYIITKATRPNTWSADCITPPRVVPHSQRTMCPRGRQRRRELGQELSVPDSAGP